MDYQKYVTQRARDIEISTIRYFFNMVNEVEGAISLCIGEPDFITPTHINLAAVQALANGHTLQSKCRPLRTSTGDFHYENAAINWRINQEVKLSLLRSVKLSMWL